MSASIVFLTGAGISAESGIPTFRGPEGFWRVGSTNYKPQELATFEAFRRMPDEIWAWYLWRRSVCRAAKPNAAHEALVALEKKLGDTFLLVTQNVDGLHLRAGNTLARTFQIHGNIDSRRCATECTAELHPVTLDERWDKERRLTQAEAASLACPRCGSVTRPHVLWFDEYYDEERFRFRSSLRAAESCRTLVVIGTSGATNLPTQMCAAAARNGAKLIVVGPEATPFSELALESGGEFLQGTAVEHVPALCAQLSC